MAVLLFLVASWAVVPLVGDIRRARPVKASSDADIATYRKSWRVLDPVVRGNLAIYPVVCPLGADTAEFLTLDEGLASGEVKVLERGQVEPAILRRRTPRRWPERPGASVNELVLVNNSPRPLILLAGEVVSGGKQNRVIGADVVVPPKSEPIPLAVFCVEHGRWSVAGAAFSSAQAMAHPEVRRQAQVHKSQQGVWNSVARAAEAASVAPATQDYTAVLSSPRARGEWSKMAAAIDRDLERELRERLRDRQAVGVVVAIGGELAWSDTFSSQGLFRKYWPKLLHSYVVEAQGDHRRFAPEKKRLPSTQEAREFLLEDRGRVTVKMEPGAYRRTEISTAEYEIVALEALGKNEESSVFLHYNKMARD